MNILYTRMAFHRDVSYDSDESSNTSDTGDRNEDCVDKDVTNDFFINETEKRMHGMNFLCAMHFKPSLEHPNEAKKVLFFYSSKTNIYEAIYKQLGNILVLQGCPSWLNAFVTYELSIDWDRLTSLAVTEGSKAAMRLKLATVRLANVDPFFKIRSTSFIPIYAGRVEYIAKLKKETNIVIDAKMIAEMRRQREI